MKRKKGGRKEEGELNSWELVLSLGVPWILRVELLPKKQKKIFSFFLKKRGPGSLLLSHVFFNMGWGEFGVNSGFEGCKFHSTGKKSLFWSFSIS